MDLTKAKNKKKDFGGFSTDKKKGDDAMVLEKTKLNGSKQKKKYTPVSNDKFQDIMTKVFEDYHKALNDLSK